METYVCRVSICKVTGVKPLSPETLPDCDRPEKLRVRLPVPVMAPGARVASHGVIVPVIVKGGLDDVYDFV